MQIPRAFDENARPQLFEDEDLRRRVESLHLNYKTTDEEVNQPDRKRRKIASVDTSLAILSEQIFQIINPDAVDGGFEQIIVYVNSFLLLASLLALAMILMFTSPGTGSPIWTTTESALLWSFSAVPHVQQMAHSPSQSPVPMRNPGCRVRFVRAKRRVQAFRQTASTQGQRVRLILPLRSLLISQLFSNVGDLEWWP